MGNLIVLILAENLQLLYFIYKTLHSLGKRFCEYYGEKKNCNIWLDPHSFLALLLPESSGLAPLPALPVGLVQSEEPF